MGKSKGPKGPKVKKEKPLTDGLLPKEMSRPQLLGHIVRLQAELVKEREERNYYMLEREKVFQLWNLLLEHIALEKEKAALYDAHLQEVEREKEGEDAFNSQRLRFLKQEQARKLGQVRLMHLVKMKHVQDEAWALQMVMRESLMGKKKEIRRAQMAFYQIIRGMYWAHAKEISDLRSDFAREIRRLETNFDRRLFEQSDKLDEAQAILVKKLDERKENQVTKLVDSHRYQTRELQKFFRDLIRHNLILIYGMKDSAKKQKMYELRSKKDYEEFKGKYDKYIASALKWKEDVARWEVEHENDDMEELEFDLHEANSEAKRHRNLLRVLECSNETLRQHMVIAEKERTNFRNEFSRSVVDVQKRSSMNKFVNLIKKVAAKREGELYAGLTDNIEKEPGDKINYFHDLLLTRTMQMTEISQDITDAATEHKDTEETYKEAFVSNEINLADIGFPIKKTGAKVRGIEDDLLALAKGPTSSRSSSRAMSKKKSSKSTSSRSGKGLSAAVGKSSHRSFGSSKSPSTTSKSLRSNM